MFGELLTAFALVLIIEGLLPAVRPDLWKSGVEQIGKLPARSIRIGGIVLLITGALMFQFVR